MNSFDIFSLVTDYTERRINIMELENLTVQMLPLYLSNPDSEAAKLAGTVELALSELNSSIRTERSVRRFLSSHVRPFVINSYSQQVISTRIISSSSSRFQDLALQPQSQVSSNEPQVVYV